jgi:hypothetical protein
VSQVPEDIHWSRVAIHTIRLLAQNLGAGPCAVNRTPGGASCYSEETLGQLLESLVSVFLGLGQDPLHRGPQLRLPPVIPGCGLCTGGVTQIGTQKKGACGGVVERWIVSGGQRKARRIASPRVLIDERSRHATV